MGEVATSPPPPNDLPAPEAGVSAAPPASAPAADEAASASAASGVSAAQPRVLVVDDDDLNRDALTRRLQRRGYEVSGACDGPDALALLDRSAFDLVLLDVMMPGMSGLEVLERIRATRPPDDLPVIMATARDQSEDIVLALQRGASDYVTKPLDFAVVLARVQTHLALKQSVQQVKELERRLSRRNAELEAANAQLVEAAERTRRDLQSAVRVQESFLPPASLRARGTRFAWAFRPCDALAGDSLNVCPLGGGHVGVYVLDVTGHGVAAALSAVAITRALSPATDALGGYADSLLVEQVADHGGPAGGASRAAPRLGEATGVPPQPLSPAQVAERLERKFPFDAATQQFFTIFYALLDVSSGACRYACAGHPPAVILRPGSPAAWLEGSGAIIGIGSSHEERSIDLKSGDRVYLYTDGVIEAMDPARRIFGKARMLQALERGRALGLEQSVALLLEEIDVWHAGAAANDDISVVAIERE